MIIDWRYHLTLITVGFQSIQSPAMKILPLLIQYLVELHLLLPLCHLITLCALSPRIFSFLTLECNHPIIELQRVSFMPQKPMLCFKIKRYPQFASVLFMSKISYSLKVGKTYAKISPSLLKAVSTNYCLLILSSALVLFANQDIYASYIVL